MYLMERQKEDQEPEKIRKRKALQEELIAAKKRKTAASNSTEVG